MSLNSLRIILVSGYTLHSSSRIFIALLLKNYSGCKLHYHSRIFTPRCTQEYSSLLLPSTHRNNWNSTGCWILLCAQCRWTWNIFKNKIIFSLIDWREPHPAWLKNILPESDRAWASLQELFWLHVVTLLKNYSGCKNIHSTLHSSIRIFTPRCTLPQELFWLQEYSLHVAFFHKNIHSSLHSRIFI